MLVLLAIPAVFAALVFAFARWGHSEAHFY